jgi:hypothetical protein
MAAAVVLISYRLEGCKIRDYFFPKHVFLQLFPNKQRSSYNNPVFLSGRARSSLAEAAKLRPGQPPDIPKFMQAYIGFGGYTQAYAGLEDMQASLR